MLKPIENAARALKNLGGLWQFRLDAQARGRAERWWRGALAEAREIAVPASYNDLYADAAARDHVGDAWYQTEIFVPRAWAGERIVLRFDAATHHAVVWLDQTEVMRHEGGYTPFEADVTALVKPGSTHRLTVCVNNELSFQTIPPGRVTTLADGRRRQLVFHDFFNYAGLHRPVWLYTTPQAHVADVTVRTRWNADSGAGEVGFDVATVGEGATRVRLLDANGKAVARAARPRGTLALAQATPWQPGAAYLYTLEVTHGNDVYTVPVGIRSVEVRDAQFLINGRPFYFTGFGKHEDSAVRGKAHDDALMVHDYALLNWIGANSFRTSHYPYAEEVLDYADRHGIVVIDETAAVGFNMEIARKLSGAADLPEELYSEEAIGSRTQAAHLQAIRELVARDKNHPSVVMWSIANEPDLRPAGSGEYFAPLVAATKALDPTRPVTVVNVMMVGPEQDTVAALQDVICLNRYWGWYAEGGDLVAAEQALEADLRAWAARFPAKPIVVTEYGADTMPGQHGVVPEMWSEEYQAELLAMHGRVFDRVSAVVGEQVWNFADFATSQGIMRVGGNRKGVFTRDRQPKRAAHVLRQRWHALCTVPGLPASAAKPAAPKAARPEAAPTPPAAPAAKADTTARRQTARRNAPKVAA
jgi:beta-glucuronidase